MIAANALDLGTCKKFIIMRIRRDKIDGGNEFKLAGTIKNAVPLLSGTKKLKEWFEKE